MQLVIGNKLYSSWSLRPWLLMRHFGIEFQDTVIPLDRPETKATRESYAPSPTVPILVDGDTRVWETSAMIEYLAERFPEHPIWPRDAGARTLARILAAEMHAGFGHLRSACPMNLGRRFAPRDRGEGVARDVARIEQLWAMARQAYGGGGPFLFGEFSAADAMFAPVCVRFDGYQIPVSDSSRSYVDAVFALPAFIEWRTAALEEPWVIDQDEADEEPVEEFRQRRESDRT